MCLKLFRLIYGFDVGCSLVVRCDGKSDFFSLASHSAEHFNALTLTEYEDLNNVVFVARGHLRLDFRSQLAAIAIDKLFSFFQSSDSFNCVKKFQLGSCAKYRRKHLTNIPNCRNNWWHLNESESESNWKRKCWEFKPVSYLRLVRASESKVFFVHKS